MEVLAVTHGLLVRAELLGDVVREAGHELREWDMQTQGTPPTTAEAVLVLGGAQNVGEELEHPWLRDEYEALRGWVDGGTPVLGVCLGAQTLAHALGARVGKLPMALAGFYETTLTEAGEADPVLGVLPQRFEALNANGRTFELPADAVALADGPVRQAFRVGDAAWGVQFHPEVRREQVLEWFRADGRELPRPYEELEREVTEKLPAWQELGRRLGRAFLGAAEARVSRTPGA
jgi:GMP synthase (glutamine-hydrolysing)